MNPIKFKDPATGGVAYTLDPIAFILNSAALGDVIAAAPVIKYMIDTRYVTPESYTVVAKAAFRDILWFVPDSNFRDFDDKSQVCWGIDPKTPMALLNKPKNGNILRITPKKLHLSTYASLAFAETVLPMDKVRYLPLRKVPVNHYGIDFSQAVIIITSYRDTTRMWRAEDILEFAIQLKSRGLLPVFVGKTDSDLSLDHKTLQSFSSLPDDISEYGVDLRNKTNLLELATIMGSSFAVCGIDSGPIHLAATTDVPIIAGFSLVSSEYRIPPRKPGTTFIALDSTIVCAGCESKWASAYHNFDQCFFGHGDCVKSISADRFMTHIDALLDRCPT